MTINLHSLFNSVDPKVTDVFFKLTKDCNQEKLNKILSKVQDLTESGKSLERALADALEHFKLAGAVSA